MDPIELQIQQQISDLQQQPGFAGYQPSFNEPAISVDVPNPTVPEPNVPGPISRTVGGIKDLVAKNFNPRQTFLNYAANKALGKQGAAIFGASMGILPLAVPMIQKAAGAVTSPLRPDPVKQGIAGYIEQVYGTTPTGQIATGPMSGYNTMGAFGSPGAIDSAISRIGKIASSRRKRESEALKKKQEALEGYVSNVQRQMTIQKGGMGADRLIDRGKPNMNIPDRNRGKVSARSTPARSSSNIPDRGRGQTGGGSRGGGSRGGGSRGGGFDSGERGGARGR